MPCGIATVGVMATLERLADPLLSPISSVLSAPLRELYAFLWRVGVVEIVEAEVEPRSGPASELDPAAPRSIASGRRQTD